MFDSKASASNPARRAFDVDADRTIARGWSIAFLSFLGRTPRVQRAGSVACFASRVQLKCASCNDSWCKEPSTLQMVVQIIARLRLIDCHLNTRCLQVNSGDSLLLDEAVLIPSLEDHEVCVFIVVGLVTEPVTIVVTLPSLPFPANRPLRSLCRLSVRRLASVRGSPFNDSGLLLGSASIAASSSQSKPP